MATNSVPGIIPTRFIELQHLDAFFRRANYKGKLTITASHVYKAAEVVVAGDFKIAGICVPQSVINAVTIKEVIYNSTYLRQHAHRFLVFRLTTNEGF